MDGSLMRRISLYFADFCINLFYIRFLCMYRCFFRLPILFDMHMYRVYTTLVPLLLLAVFWIVVVMVVQCTYTPAMCMNKCVWDRIKRLYECINKNDDTYNSNANARTRQYQRESTVDGHDKCLNGRGVFCKEGMWWVKKVYVVR